MMDSVELPTLRVHFSEWVCKVIVSRYAQTGNILLSLYDTVDGTPVATATINPHRPIPDDRVVIKDYSENSGMIAALQAAGIIGDVPVDAVFEFPVFALLVALPNDLVTRDVVIIGNDV
jgi:hypothetical protein